LKANTHGGAPDQQRFDARHLVLIDIRDVRFQRAFGPQAMGNSIWCS
jgi:hypothetical protein